MSNTNEQDYDFLSQAGYSNGVKPNFGIYCPAWVFVELGLNASEGLIYSYFYSATQNNKCQQQGAQWVFGTFNFLASLTGLQRRQVIRIIQSLEEKGLLLKEKKYTPQGGCCGNIYCAVVPKNVLATGFSGGLVPCEDRTDVLCDSTNVPEEEDKKNKQDVQNHRSDPSDKMTRGECQNDTGPSDKMTRGECQNDTGPSDKMTPINKYKINNNININKNKKYSPTKISDPTNGKSSQPSNDGVCLENSDDKNSFSTDDTQTQTQSSNSQTITQSQKQTDKAKQFLDALNEILGTSYTYLDKPCIRRLNESKATVDDVYAMVKFKQGEWKSPHMKKHLRPCTLFGEKFEMYLDESKQNDTQTHSDVYKAVMEHIKAQPVGTWVFDENGDPVELMEDGTTRSTISEDFLNENSTPLSAGKGV